MHFAHYWFFTSPDPDLVCRLLVLFDFLGVIWIGHFFFFLVCRHHLLHLFCSLLLIRHFIIQVFVRDSSDSAGTHAFSLSPELCQKKLMLRSLIRAVCSKFMWIYGVGSMSLLYFCLSRCVICSEAGLGNLLRLGAMAITAKRVFSLPIFSLMFDYLPISSWMSIIWWQVTGSGSLLHRCLANFQLGFYRLFRLLTECA